MNFEAEIARLKDTLVVTAEIQRRQGEVQRMQAEGLVVHNKEMAEIRHTLAEIGDKLNRPHRRRGQVYQKVSPRERSLAARQRS